jgi:putative phage-type endonuclease
MKKTIDALGVQIDPRVLRLIDLSSQMPPQRSPAWIKKRSEMMTASSAASVLKLTQLEINHRNNGILELESDKQVGHRMPAFNTYAKELRIKCGAESIGDGSVYTEWGVTYEPVVKELYQCFNGTIVHDFGLIPHPKYDWLGASPDGVTSKGTMIEIKCPYSRVPKGMPKCQYWVQMQIQMECCGFDECEFLDIVIREYIGSEDYYADQYDNVYSRNRQGMPKGIVIEHKRLDENSKEHLEYFYPPVLTFKNVNEENEWIAQWGKDHFGNYPVTPERAVNMLMQKESYHIRYWRIESWNSCLVKKDEEWLKLQLPNIHNFWKLVLQYRKEGLPEKYRPKIKTSNDQLYIDQETGHLTTNPKDVVGHENVECLFWDDGEDINQPVIKGTTLQDAQIHRPAGPPVKKRSVAVAPTAAPTPAPAKTAKAVVVVSKSKTRGPAAVAPSSECLFDDSDDDYDE